MAHLFCFVVLGVNNKHTDMDYSVLFMYLGFLFAAYSVVGNDVIQTLGTFLTSNGQRPWYVLWGFSASILTIVLVYGWIQNGGDPAYGRLIGDDPTNVRFPLPDPLAWWYALPPLVLLLITRYGIPVSTTFLILSIFGSGSTMGAVITKSVMGYFVAFGAAIAIYLLITQKVEKRFIDTNGRKSKNHNFWVAAQWLSTGFLWSQWLIQDLANIYVYLPRKLDAVEMGFTLLVLLGLLAYIFYNKGGTIQGIVKAKTNTADIRSATIIDFIYGIVLLVFKEWSSLPMSTTWVFIGLLSGREFAISYLLKVPKLSIVRRMALLDLAKTFSGLIISMGLVFLIKYLSGTAVVW